MQCWQGHVSTVLKIYSIISTQDTPMVYVVSCCYMPKGGSKCVFIPCKSLPYRQPPSIRRILIGRRNIPTLIPNASNTSGLFSTKQKAALCTGCSCVFTSRTRCLSERCCCGAWASDNRVCGEMSRGFHASLPGCRHAIASSP